ncbi:MAG TPA: hypothetical protein PLA74_05425 [Syntrophales bacterium]|mgnify:CR=1 FL=1|nr:hypothetical protein [Syntrophales bacterium]HPQ45103.1 hypothetical protein [Syntrophales bacterium]
MLVVSIEKLGEKIFGCIDTGIDYCTFSIEADNPIDYEKIFSKNDYNDYDQFVLSYAQIDPCTCFLENPVEIGTGDMKSLTYEYMLGVWKRIWEE